ncbi:hypothetical protein, conserved [Eimeria praecox]|uniref:Uncharacterized protein n=1 Tax=Eimeria praecox TaxID=51316 RepID=U6GPF5_9EIME|nr:hypothetical protein, conserved [Eimeria praecox]
MPQKKKGKAKGPSQKPDTAKLQEEARMQHVEESAAIVLQKADAPQKELLNGWIEEAVEIRKQEAMRGLEREIEGYEAFLGALEQQRLTEVSLCAKEKKDALLEQLKLADKIHRMAALCRKYERPEDPPPEASDFSELTEEQMKGWSKENKKLHAALKEAMETAGDDAEILQHFLKKIAAVTLEA